MIVQLQTDGTDETLLDEGSLVCHNYLAFFSIFSEVRSLYRMYEVESVLSNLMLPSVALTSSYVQQ